MGKQRHGFRPFTSLMTFLVGGVFVWFFLMAPTSISRGGPYHHRLNTGVPVSSTIKRYDLNAVTSTAHAAENGERLLICTPMVKFFPEYWDNLLKLTYPRDLIDLAFIVPKGWEGNAVLMALEKAVEAVQSSTAAPASAAGSSGGGGSGGGGKKQSQKQQRGKFGSVLILRQDFETTTPQGEKERHAKSVQKERRSALAMARNELLLSALSPTTSWVLHLDADIVETPTTLIEDMTSHDKDVLVANCFQRFTNDQGVEDVRPYDFNSWRDSETALQMAASMSEDDVLLEGYADMATYRSLMAYFRLDGQFTGDRLEELDGVGGTALLVKAEVHRDGAFFPSFPFYHLLDTEGFAKMARRLGYKCWGLPDYLVFHTNDQ